MLAIPPLSVRPAADSSGNGKSGTSREMTSFSPPQSHRALCHLQPPSSPSYTPLPEKPAASVDTSWAIQTGIARTRSSAYGARRRSSPSSTPCSAAPHVNTPGPFPRPWTSVRLVCMTPLHLRCSLHLSSAPSPPNFRGLPPKM